MIPKTCPANDILRDQFNRLLKSRSPMEDAARLIHWAEAYRMLMEIDAAEFSYWERITEATSKMRAHFLWSESQHKHGWRAA